MNYDGLHDNLHDVLIKFRSKLQEVDTLFREEGDYLDPDGIWQTKCKTDSNHLDLLLSASVSIREGEGGVPDEENGVMWFSVQTCAGEPIVGEGDSFDEAITNAVNKYAELLISENPAYAAAIIRRDK